MMITPFNLAWFVLILAQFSLPFFIAGFFKESTRKEKLSFVKWFSISTAILWVIYKYSLSKDPDFPLFFIWDELPLQPCNTMIWLGIIASLLDSDFIMDYGFYIGIPCALLALVMPESEFILVPILSPRAIGYYGTHALVVVLGVLFVSLGLVEVNYKNAFHSVLFFMFMASAAHIVNLLLRATVHPTATYYYTFGFDENFILAALKRMIPIPLLYMIPLFIVAFLVTFLETFIITSCQRMKENINSRNFASPSLS